MSSRRYLNFCIHNIPPHKALQMESVTPLNSQQSLLQFLHPKLSSQMIKHVPPGHSAQNNNCILAWRCTLQALTSSPPLPHMKKGWPVVTDWHVVVMWRAPTPTAPTTHGGDLGPGDTTQSPPQGSPCIETSVCVHPTQFWICQSVLETIICDRKARNWWSSDL